MASLITCPHCGVRPKEEFSIRGDASPVRFRTAVKVCLDDPNVDGVLVIFTPQAGTDHLTTAQLMVGLQRESNKPLFLDMCREVARRADHMAHVCRGPCICYGGGRRHYAADRVGAIHYRMEANHRRFAAAERGKLAVRIRKV